MKHLIFDIDQTLIDTQTPYLKSWQNTLSDLGCELSLEEVRPISKLSIEDLLKAAGIKSSLSQTTNIEELWMNHYNLLADSIDFYPGMKELLEDLCTNPNLTLGIVTSRNHPTLKTYFKCFQLNKYFKTIICSDDTKQGKPSPEPLLKYMQEACASPSECIYFGDTEEDMLCAKAASVTGVLCTWSDSSFHSKHANHIINAVSEVMNFL